MSYMEETVTADYKEYGYTMLAFGFKFITDPAGVVVQFDQLKSVEFELLALTINGLLHYYYHSQN
jgi:hypothetical protein